MTATIEAGRERVREEIEAATGGDFPTLIFDATGNARSMMDAFLYLAHGGRYVLVGLVNADICFSDPEFHKRETTLLSSRNATIDDFRWVMESMACGHGGRCPTGEPSLQPSRKPLTASPAGRLLRPG